MSNLQDERPETKKVRFLLPSVLTRAGSGRRRAAGRRPFIKDVGHLLKTKLGQVAHSGRMREARRKSFFHDGLLLVGAAAAGCLFLFFGKKPSLVVIVVSAEQSLWHQVRSFFFFLARRRGSARPLQIPSWIRSILSSFFSLKECYPPTTPPPRREESRLLLFCFQMDEERIWRDVSAPIPHQ